MSTHSGNPDGEGRGLFVLDVDPGIDDAVALFLAHRLVRERCVVATSFGNAPLEVTHRNLVGLKRAFGCPFPVVKGSAGPLSGREPFFDFYHGTDALGGLSHLLPEGDEKAPPLEALAGFAAPGERVVYCATGPLTNLATLVRSGSPLVPRIARVLVMGGGLQAFNCPHESEFNFHADPEAVETVLCSGLDVTIAPFDLGMSATLAPEDLARATAGSQWPVMDALLEQSLTTARAHARPNADIHDCFPVLYHVWPEQFRTRALKLSVDAWGAVREDESGHAVTVLAGLRDADLLPRTLNQCLTESACPRESDEGGFHAARPTRQPGLPR